MHLHDMWRSTKNATKPDRVRTWPSERRLSQNLHTDFGERPFYEVG